MLIIKEKLEMYKKEVEYIRIIKILILLDLGNLIFDILNMYFSYVYNNITTYSINIVIWLDFYSYFIK
jgi:hypothetical protein